MRISVLTPTYNREKLLARLYKSLIENSKHDVEIEWLIMDDGSTDNTKSVIESYIDENKISIKYFYQQNQGKMQAINNLIPMAKGDLIIECDSDDYFTDCAFEIIKKEFEVHKDDEKAYAFCFLKYDQEGNNIGNEFKNARTTMFDLYFKEGETGEKALVFFANIRKKYSHKLENNEKFVTEARMYHEMDLKNDMICINEPIMICEYQKDGYSKNIQKQYDENPHGYYMYFKEILQRDMKDVILRKRLYAIKHFIIFSSKIRRSKGNKKMDKIKELITKHKEIINYLIFGVLTTVVSLATKYLLLFTVLDAENGTMLQIAVIISWIVACLFAYFTNRKWVFESKSKNIIKEMTQFFMSRLATLGLEMLIMFVFVTYLGLNTKMWVIIWTVVAQVLIVVGNYILSKLLVFRNKSEK